MIREKQILAGLIIFLLTANVGGQQIQGRIYDSDSGEPVEFAAVYINGTTIGTITDSLGFFILDNTYWPEEIVVSHINYELKLVETNIASHYFDVPVKRKYFEISEVSALENSRRAKNLAHFEEIFLGEDDWGKDAKILNDTVLRFVVEYDSYHPIGDTTVLIQVISYFRVEALAPLQISLPKLGYTLHYDLIYFDEFKDSLVHTKVIHSAGRLYFDTYKDVSRIILNRFNRNRKKVYYHSRMHFIRSFFENRLAENGYMLYKIENNTRENSDKIINSFFIPYSFDSCSCLVQGEDKTLIVGMKDQGFLIAYYGKVNMPRDLTTREEWPYIPEYSRFYIINDECVIRKDGTTTGGMIMFTSSIGDKRIGALLPADYDPGSYDAEKEQKKRKNMEEELMKKGRI
ncbi:carboxypeptidase-like regulatory domain-containing protein [Bacteroidota bacterium]